MLEELFSIPNRGMSLDLTLDCGQSFRWEKQENNTWVGVAFQKEVVLWEKEDLICVNGAITKQELEDYFDFDTDYVVLKEMFYKDKTLKLACEYAQGIRVLKQDSWEALASFILSQNNNISRIKGLVERLCTLFGEELSEGVYAFPTPESLCNLTPDDLLGVRSGFRAKYLIDAAQRVCSGEVNLEKVKTLPLHEAQEMLMKIKGVGIKVANCTLLFGCYRLDAFPVDVWIQRAMKNYFPDGLKEEVLPFAGIAQQFIFHYIRTSPDTEEYRKQEKQNKLDQKKEANANPSLKAD